MKFSTGVRSIFSTLILLGLFLGLQACGGGSNGSNVNTDTYTLGGTAFGIKGSGLTLQNNGTDNLTISADGVFIFNTALPDKKTYNISVASQPLGQFCILSNNRGLLSGFDINDITVVCKNSTNPAQLNNSFLNEKDIARASVSGDLDGDGDIDFVIGTDAANTIWFNDGKGNFSVSLQLLGSRFTTSLVLGDLDNDGDLDLVAGNFKNNITPSEGANTVWMNDGKGNFTNSGQALGVSTTYSLALGDLDNDGDLDLVEGNYISGSLAEPDKIWLNDGKGNFTSNGQSLGNYNTTKVVLGDIDKDGDIDFVAVNAAIDQQNVLWLNNGSGLFSKSSQNLGLGGDYSAELGDIDNDNDLDLIIGSGVGGYVWFNDGRGIFTKSTQSLGNDFSVDLKLIDIDNDNDLDLIIANRSARSGNSSSMWINNGKGTFIDSGQTLGNGGSVSVTVNDYDRDGDLDVILANERSSSLILYNVNGIFTSFGQNIKNKVSYDVALGDLDGDGDLDIVYGNFGSNSVGDANTVWLNDGKGNYSSNGQSLGNDRTTSVSLGDIDADGDLDMIEGTVIANAVWFNDGSGNFTKSVQNLGNSDTISTQLADLDGDGDLDLVVGNSGSQADTVWFNNGKGVFAISGQTLGNNATYSVVLNDFDNDGDADLITGPLDQAATLWFNNGKGVFSDSGQSIGNSRVSDIAVADVDNDGDFDIAIFTGSVFNAPNYRYTAIWLNNGKGVFIDSGQQFQNNTTSSLAFSDVDGDGDPDLIIGNNSQPNIVLLNNGNGIFTDSGQKIGSSRTQNIALGDVNGDKMPDLVTANDSSSSSRFIETNKIYINATFTP